MDTTTRTVYMLSTRDQLQTQGHKQTESEGMEKDIPCNWKSKKDGLTILISDKIDVKIKTITRDKPQTIKKMVIGTYISIITLNVKGLNARTKRHRLAEWIQKQDLYTCRL